MFFIKAITGLSGCIFFLSIEGAIEPIWWGGEATIFPMLCLLVVVPTTLVIYRIAVAPLFNLGKGFFIPVCYGALIPVTMFFVINNLKPAINILFTVLIISLISSLTSGFITFVAYLGGIKLRRAVIENRESMGSD